MPFYSRAYAFLVMTAAMSAAAVTAAGMTFAVMMIVMIAPYARIIDQLAVYESLHRLVRIAGHAAVQANTGL